MQTRRESWLLSQQARTAQSPAALPLSRYTTTHLMVPCEPITYCVQLWSERCESSVFPIHTFSGLASEAAFWHVWGGHNLHQTILRLRLTPIPAPVHELYLLFAMHWTFCVCNVKVYTVWLLTVARIVCDTSYMQTSYKSMWVHAHAGIPNLGACTVHVV